MKSKTQRQELSLALPPILSRAPALMEAVIAGFEREILDWQPNPERWSVSMVIAHLAESEVDCFRLRLMRIALEECPVLEPYDQLEQFRNATVSDAGESLRRWAQERKETLKFLRRLPASVTARQCLHQKLGRLTFQEFLNEFAFHDMGHLRQVLELCRARAYYPQMGAWQQFYQVSP